jgi:hypothetical protein
MIRAIDQDGAHAGGVDLCKGDLLDGGGHAPMIPPIGPNGKLRADRPCPVRKEPAKFFGYRARRVSLRLAERFFTPAKRTPALTPRSVPRLEPMNGRVIDVIGRAASRRPPLASTPRARVPCIRRLRVKDIGGQQLFSSDQWADVPPRVLRRKRASARRSA